MEWWNRVMFPMRRVWIGVATRLGIRKTGLRRLRHEVRTCEYEDVHVMWEMLRKTETETGGRFPPAQRKRPSRHVWAMFEWASRRVPYHFCRSF